MLKLTCKKSFLFLLFGFVMVLIFQKHQQLLAMSEEEVATANILKAIRTSNTWSLVRPNESTIIIRPSIHKRCRNSGSDVFVLFIVVSSPDHKKRRDVFRATLATYIQRKTFVPSGGKEKKNKLLFFIGLSENNLLNEEVRIESDFHGDIVVDNLHEAYLNLTVKTLRMLKFFQEDCRKARYVVKIDDDVHLNVFNFFQFLKNVSKEEASHLIAGHKYSKLGRDKNPASKWYTPTDSWPHDRLPEFTAGLFYFLGTNAASKLYNASLTVPLFHLEDVFLTGIVATTQLKMKIHDIPEIMVYWFPSFNLYTTSCTFQSYMAVHGADENILRCWSRFNSEQFECGRLTPIYFYC